MSLYIGVDVGTQGSKAVIYNSKKNQVVSRGAYSYDILKTKVPGRAEQHPSMWIEVCQSRRCKRRLNSVHCLTRRMRAETTLIAICLGPRRACRRLTSVILFVLLTMLQCRLGLYFCERLNRQFEAGLHCRVGSLLLRPL